MFTKPCIIKSACVFYELKASWKAGSVHFVRFLCFSRVSNAHRLILHIYHCTFCTYHMNNFSFLFLAYFFIYLGTESALDNKCFELNCTEELQISQMLQYFKTHCY